MKYDDFYELDKDSNAITINSKDLLEFATKAREDMISEKKPSSLSLSPGEDNDSFYTDSTPDVSSVELEVHEPLPSSSKEEKEEAEMDPADPEKDYDIEKEVVNYSDDISTLLFNLEKNMGEVYVSDYTKNIEYKKIKAIHEALEPFNRDFTKFLDFLGCFTKKWYIERHLFVMFLVCFMLDNPEYYCSCFDSNYFSINDKYGYGTLIDNFIKEAKLYPL